MKPIEAALNNAPGTCGVYIMKDRAGSVIYVGKAKNLKKRLSSYLSMKEKRYQIGFLMNRVSTVEFITTSNENEAFILEDSLIKKYKPRYNMQLKDDKRYLCIMLNKNHDFPKFEFTRKTVKARNIFYWGPYPSAKVIRNIIGTVQKIFPLRRCSDTSFLKRNKPCIYFDMQQCKAPCAGLISKEDYMKLVEGAVNFINGKNRAVTGLLKKLMWEAAEKQDFEKAAFLRDIIENKISLADTMGVVSHRFNNIDILGLFTAGEKTNICVLFMRHGKIIHKKEFTVPSAPTVEDKLSAFILNYYNKNVIPPDEILIETDIQDRKLIENLIAERFEKKVKIRVAKLEEELRLIKNASLNAANYRKTDRESLIKLKELLRLKDVPKRIECFDVAHMMGMQPLCAMTVAVDGEISKKDYRLFNFDVPSFDDYKMLYEALKRRFRHSEWEIPQILLIDGGRGQLSVALKVIEEFALSDVLPVAISKDEANSVFIAGRKNPLSLNKGDEAYKLLSRLREEAHRFANYHLKRRLKKVIKGG